MSWFTGLFGEQKRNETTGFFVFDYSAMESFYGKQAFEAIYAALRSSSGVCVFNDGDLSNPETVRRIAQKANLVISASSKSPLADLNGPFKFGPYVAAMWTDTNSNFGRVHSGLTACSVPGYLGYMTLSGRNDLKSALYCFSSELHLVSSLGLRDGKVVESTYGVGR